MKHNDIIKNLFENFYETIVINGYRPFIIVNLTQEDFHGREYLLGIEKEKIILDISSDATMDLTCFSECVTFSARFNGYHQSLSIPYTCISYLYAKNNADFHFMIEVYRNRLMVGWPKEMDLPRHSYPPEKTSGRYDSIRQSRDKPKLTVIKGDKT